MSSKPSQDSSSSGNTYIYQELPPGDFIRILVLLPGQGEDPLTCKLRNSNLDDDPVFDALSYVWGSGEKIEQIVCDDKISRITANLASALRRIRNAYAPRELWADSICIDQDNMKEKSHQVGLMGLIYLKARRVLIHIVGDDGGYGVEIEALVVWLNGMICEKMRNTDRAKDNTHEYPLSAIKEDLKMMSSTGYYLNMLMNQPWWGRGWVVQEAILAKEATILWGPRAEINYRSLIRSVLWINIYCSEILGGISLGIHGALHLAEFPEETRGNMHFPFKSFLDILSFTRYLNLYDPLDRIYAFLSLYSITTAKGGNASKDLILYPDYTKPKEVVYTDLARRHLLTGDANVLHYVQHTEATLTDNRAPTWVPRWDLNLYPSNHGSYFKPLRGRKNDPAKPMFEQDVLLVQGVLLDRIEHIETPFGDIEQLTDLVPLWLSRVEFNDISAYKPDLLPLAFLTAIVQGTYEGSDDTWKEATENVIQLWRGSSATRAQDSENLNTVLLRIQSETWGRRLISTEKGYLGSAPEAAQKGDWCCIVFGTTTPLILREIARESTQEQRKFLLVGNTWIVSRESQQSEEFGTFMTLLGSEQSKEWTEWDIKEETIHIT